MEVLNYLHSKGVYYGDMKPENVLIFRNYKVKVGDFGISFKMEERSNYLKGITPDYALDKIN